MDNSAMMGNPIAKPPDRIENALNSFALGSFGPIGKASIQGFAPEFDFVSRAKKPNPKSEIQFGYDLAPIVISIATAIILRHLSDGIKYVGRLPGLQDYPFPFYPILSEPVRQGPVDLVTYSNLKSLKGSVECGRKPTIAFIETKRFILATFGSIEVWSEPIS